MYLALFVNKHINDGNDHIPYVMMAYPAAMHESIKYATNLLILGCEKKLA